MHRFQYGDRATRDFSAAADILVSMNRNRFKTKLI